MAITDPHNMAITDPHYRYRMSFQFQTYIIIFKFKLQTSNQQNSLASLPSPTLATFPQRHQC